MDSTIVVSVSGIMFGVIAALAAGGAIATIIRRLAADKAAVDYAEKLFLSFPPETKEVISRLTDTLDAVVGLLKEVQTPSAGDTPTTPQ